MSGTCQNCGHISSDSPEDSPPNPSHCGNCPPWICDGCGQTCSFAELCVCWIPLDDMALADIKAVFAASDMSIDLPRTER